MILHNNDIVVCRDVTAEFMAILQWHTSDFEGEYRLDPEGHIFGKSLNRLVWYKRYLVYDTYFICRMPDIAAATAYVTAIVKFNIKFPTGTLVRKRNEKWTRFRPESF